MAVETIKNSNMDNNTILKDGERLDDTGFGGLKVIQKKDFGYGVDSVLLAAFAAGETGGRGIRRKPANGSELRIADLGTGNGIIAFIASHKIQPSHLTGVEMNPEAYDRAMRACRHNNIEDRVEFINSDILSVEGNKDFDVVLSNPPYFRRTESRDGTVPGGTGSVDSDRYISRHETTADIWDFARVAATMLRSGGDFCIVHRPDRLVDIFEAMRSARIEPKELQFITPAPGKAANMVLVHGIKDAGPELRLLPELAVHKTEGGYSDDIMKIYERV